MQSVLKQGSSEREEIPGEGGKKSTVNKYRTILPPSCLSFIMPDFIKNAYGNLCEVWPLSGLSCGTLDEEEHFICCVLTSKAHGFGQCLLLAILMTFKFDMRALAKASWLVALCLSPERLTTAYCSFD